MTFEEWFGNYYGSVTPEAVWQAARTIDAEMLEKAAEAMWDKYRESDYTPEWKREVTWQRACELAKTEPLWKHAVVDLAFAEARACFLAAGFKCE